MKPVCQYSRQTCQKITSPTRSLTQKFSPWAITWECDTACDAEMCSLQLHITFIITAPKRSELLFCITDITFWKKKKTEKVNWKSLTSQQTAKRRAARRGWGKCQKYPNVSLLLHPHRVLSAPWRAYQTQGPRSQLSQELFTRAQIRVLSDGQRHRAACSAETNSCSTNSIQIRQSAELSLGLHTPFRQLQLNG